MSNAMQYLAALTAVTLCALVLWPRGDGRAQTSPELALKAAGDIKLWNSKQGQPLVGANLWRPGRAVRGRVVLGNRGTGPLVARLTAARIQTTGVDLGARVRVRVRRVGGPRLPRERRLYKGPLRELKNVRIARLRAQRKQRYRVVARFIKASGNAYQGSTLRFALRWRGTHAPTRATTYAARIPHAE